MVTNFWKKLKKPFFVLAPMANVTDAPFRRIISKYGKPDAMWTEFLSADGLVSSGREKLMADLEYSEAERPIVAQLFSTKPEKMEEAAKLVLNLGFDGLDINMGCPDRAVLKQGAGGALIKNKKLAAEIIAAAKVGTAGKIPVSVKTRIGFLKDELEIWLGALLENDLSAITIHARTVRELSAVPAHWDAIKRAARIRNQSGKDTRIIGNGDVADLKVAKKLAKETGADGIMIGRGIFGNPWLFANLKKAVSMEKRFEVLIEHVKLFDRLFKKRKNFEIMKKHFKAYVSGFDGAKELRVKLMQANNAKAVEKILSDYLQNNPE